LAGPNSASQRWSGTLIAGP